MAKSVLRLRLKPTKVMVVWIGLDFSFLVESELYLPIYYLSTKVHNYLIDFVANLRLLTLYGFHLNCSLIVL